MFFYIVYFELAGIVALIAVSLVVFGRAHLPTTTLACVVAMLVIGLVDRARSHESTPFWHWGALSVGMPLVMALIAGPLSSSRLHRAWQVVIVFLCGLVALALIAAYVVRASSA